MEKLTSNEIIKLLDALVGSTEPIGETNYDLEVVDNLQNQILQMEKQLRFNV